MLNPDEAPAKAAKATADGIAGRLIFASFS